jgi:hypothetical protein
MLLRGLLNSSCCIVSLLICVWTAVLYGRFKCNCTWTFWESRIICKKPFFHRSAKRANQLIKLRIKRNKLLRVDLSTHYPRKTLMRSPLYLIHFIGVISITTILQGIQVSIWSIIEIEKISSAFCIQYFVLN